MVVVGVVGVVVATAAVAALMFRVRLIIFHFLARQTNEPDEEQNSRLRNSKPHYEASARSSGRSVATVERRQS